MNRVQGMNILLISHFFPPHLGGVETATYNTAKKLVEFGHTVVVLTSRRKLDKQGIQQLEGFIVYRFKPFELPQLKILPQLSSLGIIPGAIIRLPKLIKNYNIQLIHLEGRFFPISYISVILNKLIFKRPAVVSAQGRLEIGITGLIENMFDAFITKYLYQKLKKVICVSESLKNRFLNFKIKEDKLIVIPNGVDITKFSRIESSNLLNKYLKGKSDFKKVIFVGRLDVQKGVEYLIRAIPIVLKSYKRVHFFILGNGNLENELKRLAKNLNVMSNLTFLKAIHLEKMPEFYSSADIFCLPSLHEGFPLSIAEALSIGLIVVASSTEGIPEAIKENENGFLAEPKNVPQLAEKLIKALNLDDEQIKKIQNNNIKLAKEKYSWENIVKQIENVYNGKL
ncbi:MAG: glycosyltransferase family 4 protein [Candidatus Hodarchaeota archaeon]